MEFKLFIEIRYKYPNIDIYYYITRYLLVHDKEERKAGEASWKLRHDRLGTYH